MGRVDAQELKTGCHLWVKACHSIRPFKYVFVKTTAAVLMSIEIQKNVSHVTCIQILVESTLEEATKAIENKLIPHHKSTLLLVNGGLYIAIHSPSQGSEILIPVQLYLPESKNHYPLTIDKTTYRPLKIGERSNGGLQSINTGDLDSDAQRFEEFYSSFDDASFPLLKSTSLLRIEILGLEWKLGTKTSALWKKAERSFQNFGVFLEDPALDEDAKGFEDFEREIIQTRVIEMMREGRSRFIRMTDSQCESLGKLGLNAEALKEALKAIRPLSKS